MPRFAALALALVNVAGCGGDEPRRVLSVASARTADGPVEVAGFLVSRGGETRLCAALAESYPPQCGEPSLCVEGLDLERAGELERAEGVTWSEREVTLAGTVAAGVLRIA